MRKGVLNRDLTPEELALNIQHTGPEVLTRGTEVIQYNDQMMKEKQGSDNGFVEVSIESWRPGVGVLVPSDAVDWQSV